MSEHIIRKDSSRDPKDMEVLDQASSIRLYTSKGRHDYEDSDGNYRVVAEPLYKARENPYVHAIAAGGHKFLIKIGEGGRLFNPYGMYSEGMETKQRVGRPTWKFITTNQTNFNNYVEFLRTKNEVFLKHAEREII